MSLTVIQVLDADIEETLQAALASPHLEERSAIVGLRSIVTMDR